MPLRATGFCRYNSRNLLQAGNYEIARGNYEATRLCSIRKKPRPLTYVYWRAAKSRALLANFGSPINYRVISAL